MPQFAKNTRQLKQAKPATNVQLPAAFEETVKNVEKFALLETHKSARQKQLYYHNCVHVHEVKQRAETILKAIVSCLQENFQGDAGQAHLLRMKQLLDLSAIAHDMVQNFIPQTQPGTPRQRESGVNEAATISKLITYIEDLNQQILQQDPYRDAIFTESDIQTIKEAIEATICIYDPSDRSLYQLSLYNSDKKISLVALILALADLGTLGMEGIEAYNQEGSLIFLEENPDVIPMLWDKKTQQILVEDETGDKEKQALYEGIRQRLLKRAQFQVNFAKGRYSRFDREVAGLPAEAIQVLKTDVFKYLTEETIQEIEKLTPTTNETTLQELIEFFKLEKYIKLIFCTSRNNPPEV